MTFKPPNQIDHNDYLKKSHDDL